MSEFKPGDVVVHPEYGRGVVLEAGLVGFAGHVGVTSVTAVAADLRRLVVIDPDNEDDTDRLVDILENHEWQPKRFDSSSDLAIALREFADPKPPKPEEPTGWLAAVEDADGVRWVLIDDSESWWFRPSAPAATDSWRPWDRIDVVRVISEGVTS